MVDLTREEKNEMKLDHLVEKMEVLSSSLLLGHVVLLTIQLTVLVFVILTYIKN